MRPTRANFNSIRQEILILDGGINENVSSLELKGGELIGGHNYQLAEGTNGGYSSIKGYERFDGTTLPSEVVVKVFTLNNVTEDILVGQTLTGQSSSQTAIVLGLPEIKTGSYSTGDARVFIEVGSISGEFTQGESISNGTNIVGEYRSALDILGGSEKHHVLVENSRAAIAEVPGEGNVLGVHIFNNDLYAFRNKVGGVSAGMYKATSGGWVEIDTSTNPLPPGGSYVFTNYNFLGSSNTLSMYWCNGEGKARSYDGSIVTVIDNSGMDPNDTPKNILARNDRLFLVYSGGSLQYSSSGDPTDWTTTSGEIGIGREITDLSIAVGGALIVFCDEAIKILKGYSSNDFVLETFSDVSGAYSNTAKRMFGTVFFMDDRGVTTLSAVQDFGDFGANSISQRVYRSIQEKKSLTTCASASREANQYRLFFSDGSGIYFSFLNKKLRGVSKVFFDNPVYSITEGEDALGNVISYFTSSGGYVYKIDSGTSFDGGAINTLGQLSFYHYKSPRSWKRFKQIVLEVASPDNLDIYIRTSFDYKSGYLPTSVEIQKEIVGPGDRYGEGVWSVMRYSGSELTNRVPFQFRGIGSNMSVSFVTSYTYKKQHTIQNMIVDYQLSGRQL